MASVQAQAVNRYWLEVAGTAATGIARVTVFGGGADLMARLGFAPALSPVAGIAR